MVNNMPRKNILVVDEQEDITWSLAQALSDKEIAAKVLTAADGREALDKLSGETIHLLIMDITMLESAGQDLFIEVKKKFPAVAVIVMTTLPVASHKKEGALGENLFYVEKPFDINHLKQLVIRIFARKTTVDLSQAGINLTDIIQLKCMAGSTTTLQINKRNQQGAVYFKDGEVIHATCEQMVGEEALFAILDFGKGVITAGALPKDVSATISRPGITLVKEFFAQVETSRQKAARQEAARKKAAAEEAARRKVEAEEEARRKAEEEEAARKKAAAEEEARKKAEEEDAARKKAEEEAAARKKAEEEAAARRKAAEEEAARIKAEEEAEAARKKAAEEEEARKKIEEEEAARKRAEEAANYEKRKNQTIHAGLKDLLTGLSNIQEFVAAGVLSPTGQLLTHTSTDQNLDLEMLAENFNKLFRKIRKTSTKISFEKLKETLFTFEGRSVIIRRSAPTEEIRFHLMVIMESSLNLDLVDRVMDDFQSRVQKKISQL
ncbi:MAG: response regulator [Proteobacteria bacterium]|nr:response regulator [Pseudomonadota bacterium]MBU1737397.1 response regulator [Pseudomonadota bacterium]